MSSQDLLEYTKNLETICKTNIELDLIISIATSSILTKTTKETCKNKTRIIPNYNKIKDLAKCMA